MREQAVQELRSAEVKSDDANSATPGARNRDELAATALSIRPAVPDDAATIANLVYELAVYERLEHEVKGTVDDFRRHLFGSHPRAEVSGAGLTVLSGDCEPAGEGSRLTVPTPEPPAGRVRRRRHDLAGRRA